MSFIDIMSTYQLMLLIAGVITTLSLAAYWYEGDLLNDPAFNTSPPSTNPEPAVSNQQLADLTRAIACLQLQLINVEQVTERTEAAVALANSEQNIFHNETRQSILNSRDQVIKTTYDLFRVADRKIGEKFDKLAEQAEKDYVSIKSDIALGDARVERVRRGVDQTRDDVESLRTGMRDHFMTARQVIRSQAAELKTDIADVKADIAEVNTNVEEVMTDISDIRNDVIDVKTSLTETVEQADQHHEEITKKIEDSALDLQRSIIDLFGLAEDKADKRQEELYVNQEDVRERLVGIESLQNQTIDDVTALVGNVADAKTEITDIKTSVSAIDGKLVAGVADLKMEIQTIDRQITEFRTDLPRYINKLQRELTTKFDEVNININASRDEILLGVNRCCDDIINLIENSVLVQIADLNANLEERTNALQQHIEIMDEDLVGGFQEMGGFLRELKDDLIQLRTTGVNVLGLVMPLGNLIQGLTVRIHDLEETVVRCCGRCGRMALGGANGGENDDDEGDDGADDAGAGDADIAGDDTPADKSGNSGVDAEIKDDDDDDDDEIVLHDLDLADATLVPFHRQEAKTYPLPISLHAERQYLTMTRPKQDAHSIDTARFKGRLYALVAARLFGIFSRVGPAAGGIYAMVDPRAFYKAFKEIVDHDSANPLAQQQWELYHVACGSFNDVYFLESTGPGERRKVIVRLPLKSGFWQPGDTLAMSSAFRLTNLLAGMGIRVPRTYFADCSGDFLHPIRLSIEEFLQGGDAFSIWNWPEGSKEGAFELPKRRALLKGLAEEMAKFHHNKLWAKKMGLLDPQESNGFDAERGWPTIPLVRYGFKNEPYVFVLQDFFQGYRQTDQAAFTRSSDWRNEVHERWWRMDGGKFAYYFRHEPRTEADRQQRDMNGIEYVLILALKEALNERTDAWAEEEKDGVEKFHLAHMDLDLQNILPRLTKDDKGDYVVNMGIIDWDDAKFMPADRGYFSYPMWLLKPAYLPAHVTSDQLSNPHTSREQLAYYRKIYCEYLSRALGNNAETRSLVKKYTYGSHLARLWDDTMERIIGNTRKSYTHAGSLAEVLIYDLESQCPEDLTERQTFWWSVGQFGTKHAERDEYGRRLEGNELSDEERTLFQKKFDEADTLGSACEVSYFELKEMLGVLLRRP